VNAGYGSTGCLLQGSHAIYKQTMWTKFRVCSAELGGTSTNEWALNCS